MKALLFTLMFALPVLAKAQMIPNPGFESWNAGTSYMGDTLPQQWWSAFCNTIHPSTDAVQGTYASRIQGFFACGIAPGIMVSGEQPASGDLMYSGTPVTGKPDFISGYYKLTDAVPGDSAEATVILKRYNSATMSHDTIGFGVVSLPPTATYTAFTIPVTDFAPGIDPDSMVIVFLSSKHYLIDTDTWVLPNLYIDKIMPPPNMTGIEDRESPLAESTVFPNPSSGRAIIRLDQDVKYSSLSLLIFNSAGMEVYSEKNISGSEVEINQSNLPAGAYLYRLSDGSRLVGSGKLLIR